MHPTEGYWGNVTGNGEYPNNGEPNGKDMMNELELGLILRTKVSLGGDLHGDRLGVQGDLAHIGHMVDALYTLSIPLKTKP